MFANNYWMSFCEIQNNQDRGRGYHLTPNTEADNSYRDLDYSGYHKNLTNLIIVLLYNEGKNGSHVRFRPNRKEIVNSMYNNNY